MSNDLADRLEEWITEELPGTADDWKALHLDLEEAAAALRAQERHDLAHLAPWPPCMAPDGAEPCEQYQQLAQERDELRQEVDILKILSAPERP